MTEIQEMTPRQVNLLTLPQFARLLRLSYHSAWDMVITGKVHAIKVGPKSGRWRIPMSEVERLLAGNGMEG